MPFGGSEEGVSIQGVVIKPEKPGVVVAARSGRVSFVDQALRGYGKTVILEHSKEFSTVYARNSVILVSAGQSVKRGDPIAETGFEGKGASPQLYFEVRRHARAEDPLKYLS